MQQTHLGIGLVASELGVSTSTLRKWETRYGFPRAMRSATGRRYYDTGQIDQLRRAKTLLDAGGRASQIFADLRNHAAADTKSTPPMEPNGFEARAQTPAGTGSVVAAELRTGTDSATASLAEAATDADVEELIALLRDHQLDRCRHLILGRLAADQPLDVVEQLLGPMIVRVGNEWFEGRLEVFQEHAITSLLDSALATVTAEYRTSGRPILLAPAPGDRHTLGLRLLELVLTGAGARCLRLLDALPATQMAAAARAYDAAVVGLGVGICRQPRLIRQSLELLVGEVPAGTRVWVGGRGVSRLGPLPDGVRYLQSARQALQAFEQMKHPDDIGEDRTRG
jgi:DNA-binding transcriptional MerR regulator